MMSDVITRLRSFDRKLDRKLFYISNIIRSIILWIFYIFFHVTSILCNFTSLNFPKSAVITIALFVSQKFVDQFGQHFTRIDCNQRFKCHALTLNVSFPIKQWKTVPSRENSRCTNRPNIRVHRRTVSIPSSMVKISSSNSPAWKRANFIEEATRNHRSPRVMCNNSIERITIGTRFVPPSTWT